MIDLFRQLKLEYKDYLIIFKSGSFYISFDEDATVLNNIFNYKIVELKNNIKSGFPLNMLNDNIKIIESNKINYIIIDNKRIINKKSFTRNKFNAYTKSVFDIISNSNRISNIVKKIESINNDSKDEVLNKIELLLEKYERT